MVNLLSLIVPTIVLLIRRPLVVIEVVLRKLDQVLLLLLLLLLPHGLFLVHLLDLLQLPPDPQQPPLLPVGAGVHVDRHDRRRLLRVAALSDCEASTVLTAAIASAPPPDTGQHSPPA